MPTTVVFNERDMVVIVYPDKPMLGNFSSSYSIDRARLENYFHLPIATAAEHLSIGVTTLKKISRMLGVQRWPFKSPYHGGPSYESSLTSSCTNDSCDLQDEMNVLVSASCTELFSSWTASSPNEFACCYQPQYGEWLVPLPQFHSHEPDWSGLIDDAYPPSISSPIDDIATLQDLQKLHFWQFS